MVAFAEILTGRHSDRLDFRMASADVEELPHLHRFVTGLRRDYQAVRNRLDLTYAEFCDRSQTPWRSIGDFRGGGRALDGRQAHRRVVAAG